MHALRRIKKQIGMMLAGDGLIFISAFYVMLTGRMDWLMAALIYGGVALFLWGMLWASSIAEKAHTKER